MNCPKNQQKKSVNGPQFLMMGTIGLHITVMIHGLLVLLTDATFWVVAASMGGLYPTWITFFVIGLIKSRKDAKSIPQG